MLWPLVESTDCQVPHSSFLFLRRKEVRTVISLLNINRGRICQVKRVLLVNASVTIVLLPNSEVVALVKCIEANILYLQNAPSLSKCFMHIWQLQKNVRGFCKKLAYSSA